MSSMSDFNKSIYILPADTEWLIISEDSNIRDTGFKLIFSNKYFKFLILPGSEDLPEISTGDISAFIFGHIYPRNNVKEGDEIQFKGQFIYIKHENEKLIICNDHFGIQKFFYRPDPVFIASNKIENILNYQTDIVQDRKALIKYTLFNYFVDGETIYKGICYSQPATKIQIKDRDFHISKHWNGIISASAEQPVLKEKVKLISECWLEILEQYSSSFSGDSSLTLTGGFDSRMVLAGLMNQKKTVRTVTFGNPESIDAKNARRISGKLRIPHKTLSDDIQLKENFDRIATDAVRLSGSLLNLLRMNRIWHLKTGLDNKNIFLGYAGSEILRGLYPDGLLQSEFFLNSGKPGANVKELICSILDKHFVEYNQEEIEEAVAEITSSAGNNIHHLLDVVIPLHFGEDMRWLELNGINSVSPFLDVDFYELLARLNCIALLKEAHKQSGSSHFSRIDNPYLPARLIKELYPPLSRLNLGKGYSPSDYIFSKYFAGIKFFINKMLIKSPPVALLFPWYHSFLESYLKNTSGVISNCERLKAIEYMNSLTKFREIDFLPVTKFVNRLIINKITKTKSSVE